MEWSGIAPRLGLNVPYEWWPAAPLLKQIEAAGFAWTQIPSPPPSVLRDARQLRRHASALKAALATSELRLALHAPTSLRAGERSADRAFGGLLDYAAASGADRVVYHAAAYLDEPASADLLLAETRSLARLAGRAEALGVQIALENLAPVYPGPDLLSFSPMLLRTVANRLGSPAIGLCLDLGHLNVVAGLRHTDPVALAESVLDRTIIFHLHDNLGARRGLEATPELDPLRLDLHLEPGRGSVPWRRLAPILAEHPAPLMLEIHPAHRRSAAYLHRRALRVLGELGEPALVN
jgi:sugar phosphate isomerase/epimerase